MKIEMDDNAFWTWNLSFLATLLLILCLVSVRSCTQADIEDTKAYTAAGYEQVPDHATSTHWSKRP